MDLVTWNMNHLMHLYIAGEDLEAMVGNMMGDFVKGRIAGHYPPGIRRGIEMHRRIDSFASTNPHFLTSKRRIDGSFGHYRAIMVDIFYDHFLAGNWEKYSSVPFTEYIRNVHQVLSAHEDMMPEKLRDILPRLFSGNWLLFYADINGIASVLQRMSARISRVNPLGDGVHELSRKYDLLRDDFFGFMPELEKHISDIFRIPA
jgi:acyl carrier protein phosphodiesterase